MEAAAASGGKVSLTVTDITDEGTLKAWVSGVTQALGESGLDVLISNCRDPHARPLEVLPVAAVRHEFEVNVFAGLAVSNTFLPALRRARGRIVQIAAMTGRLPPPFNGPSSASKAALEAFADVYRTELRAPSSFRMVDAAWRAVWRVRRRPAVSDQSIWRVYSAKVTRTSLAGLRGVGYARLSSSTGMVRTPAVWRAYSAKPG